MHINETGGERSRIGVDPGRNTPRPARVSDGGAPSFDAALQAVSARTNEGLSEIPAAVWSDIDRASQLVDTLAERGQAVRFSTNVDTGKVVAGLYDSTGRQLQPLSLTELIPDPYGTPSLDTTSI